MKTKTVQALSTSSAQPSKEKEVATDNLALVDPSMRRALSRRDTEDAVDRLYVSSRLKTIPSERLASAVNKKGEKLRGFLLDAERLRRSSQGRFPRSFG